MEQFVVSARKYRPQTFIDVVGQGAITQTLLNAIETNHLGQALLFTGPRGVGKTTCARILARKINQPGYDDPNEDFTFNVFELDAASNNSVEDIRSLIDQVRIPPQTGQFKVYIIDEVHMLSTSAFNAFLKTLEEPPKHAIFILATTEKHKILPTILSRCQIFDFRRISIQDAKAHLARVAENQGVAFEEDALHIIAEKADGAMRDALSIFDRVVSFCGKNLTREAVAENLQVLDYESFSRMTHFLVSNQLPQALVMYNEIIARGFDGHHFIVGLGSHFRDILMAQSAHTQSLVEKGERAFQSYLEQAKSVPTEFLLRGIEIASQTDIQYKTTQNQRLLVELALMQLASITFDGEKKKVNGFIIPASHFYNTHKELEVTAPELVSSVAAVQNNAATVATPPVSPTGIPHVASIQSVQVNTGTSNRVDPNAIIQYSALSIKSIQTKKQLEAQLASQQPNAEENLPETPFTETDLRLCWNQYADRLGSQGQKILESLLRMSQPSLHMNFKIVYELPNEGSRLDFESGKYEFVQFLRTKLNNFKLDIEVIVNESFETRRAYTPQEKYQRLVELNPAIEQLRQTFDLNF